ncbi:MAG TPA: Sapep family Mn(2+)-dependent dipeptidase, partial [Methanoregula sp.]|nr:Sapep family Mn(2+)-dependent dipeptidase [Methanoregula sp.]
MSLSAMLPILPFTATISTDEKRGESPEGALLDRIVERDAETLVASVQELVRIPSAAGEPEPGAPFGPGPQKALLRALEIAGRLGFSTTNLDNYAGFAEFGSGKEYVMALGHVDTVPEGGNWTYPPFGGEIHDGKIYGRGALDDKGPALAALFGARAVMESGLALSRRVRVVFGADEETGEEDVRRYLSKESPPVSGFTPDADFPVVFAEKGILWVELGKKLGPPAHGTFVTTITGGTVPNMVPDSAAAEIRTVHPEITLKQCGTEPLASCSLVSTTLGVGEIHVRARGMSAHASKPEEGKNAIQELLAFLSEQKLSPGGMTDAIRFLCRNLAKETDGKSFGLATSDEVSGALTLNAGMIETRGNLLVVTLDIRYPVTAVADRN